MKQDVMCVCVCVTLKKRSCRVFGSDNPQDVTEHERDAPRVNV
jgi:hypothetical protein